jgi:hypothetical protein
MNYRRDRVTFGAKNMDGDTGLVADYPAVVAR